MKKPKSTEPGDKGHTQPPPPQAAKAKRSVLGKALAGVVAGVAMLGAACAALELSAQATVSVLPPVQPAKAFTAPFTVVNKSVVSLNHVNVTVGVCRVDMNLSGAFDPRKPRAVTIRGDGARFASGGTACTGPYGARFYDHNWTNQTLLPDEKFSAALDGVLDWLVPQQARESVIVTSAVITIVVQFQPWFVPWRRELEFRFATQRAPNGALSWITPVLDNK
jgi:hypothetical protein